MHELSGAISSFGDTISDGGEIHTPFSPLLTSVQRVIAHQVDSTPNCTGRHTTVPREGS